MYSSYILIYCAQLKNNYLCTCSPVHSHTNFARVDFELCISWPCQLHVRFYFVLVFDIYASHDQSIAMQAFVNTIIKISITFKISNFLHRTQQSLTLQRNTITSFFFLRIPVFLGYVAYMRCKRKTARPSGRNDIDHMRRVLVALEQNARFNQRRES